MEGGRKGPQLSTTSIYNYKHLEMPQASHSVIKELQRSVTKLLIFKMRESSFPRSPEPNHPATDRNGLSIQTSNAEDLLLPFYQITNQHFSVGTRFDSVFLLSLLADVFRQQPFCIYHKQNTSVLTMVLNILWFNKLHISYLLMITQTERNESYDYDLTKKERLCVILL